MGLVRVSRKGSPSVSGSFMVNLMYVIFPGSTGDIINIPEPPLD